MSALVHELQSEALSKGSPLTDLLRKAYLVSRKLKVAEFETWTKRELDGYRDIEPIKYPSYRIIHGTPMMLNPYHGWQPIIFHDSETREVLSKSPCYHSIAEIEHLLEKMAPGHKLHTAYSGETSQDIMNLVGIELQPSLHIEPSALSHILDSVRNIVLQWSIKLEEDGILGERLSFSNEEIATAQHASYTINYFAGHVNHSQIQQGTVTSDQVKKT